jgi:alcohol dehydrogenase (cytochrome c)
MRKTLLLLGVLLTICPGTQAQVTYERLVDAAKEPHNWLTYSGRYSGWRYSTLDQINATNVNKLTMQWAFQTGDIGEFETTPIAVDGILYGTGQNNRAFAIDARTGRAIWRYQRTLPEQVRPCCGRVNRGFAILGDKLFMATLDAHVIALDAKSGNVVWDTTAADYKQANTFTVAPLALRNQIIVGVSGGEYGIRGFIDAYDAGTGRRLWRFDTVPGPGEPGHETWDGDSWKTGGAPAWITGSYDPDLNLIYWPTGNPSPSNYGGARKGDNLFSNSMLALDADTGRLRWHYQFTPHDVYDYDATQIPVLIDAEWDGRPASFSSRPIATASFTFSTAPTDSFSSRRRSAKLHGQRASQLTASPSSMPPRSPTPMGLVFARGQSDSPTGSLPPTVPLPSCFT